MTRMVLVSVLAGGLGVYVGGVTLETADIGERSSFTDGANWFDSLPPSSDKDYFVGLGDGGYLLSPYNNLAKGVAYSWSGGALTLGDENNAGWLGINIYHGNGVSGDPLYQKADWFSRDKGAVLPYMSVTGGVDVDLAGNPRYVNDQGKPYAADALPDLGCYEVQVRFPPPRATMIIIK